MLFTFVSIANMMAMQCRLIFGQIVFRFCVLQDLVAVCGQVVMDLQSWLVFSVQHSMYWLSVASGYNNGAQICFSNELSIAAIKYVAKISLSLTVTILTLCRDKSIDQKC
jgi:hypothetical protein